MLKELSDHVRYFESEGLEVGLWINSFGFGTPMSSEEIEKSKGMTKIKSVFGLEGGDAFCPEDPLYMEKYCDWVRAIAEIHPKLIMLDDDLCLSVRPGIGCFCERHMKLLEDKIGHPLNLECAVAFNNNAKCVKKMPKRMIVDVVAAKYLQEKGIDVGLVSAQASEGIVYPTEERFGDTRISAAV